MQKAKWMIAGFLLILALFLLVALLLPSKVTVSKSIIINAPSLSVAGQIIDFDKWKNWHPAFLDKEISVSIPANQNDSIIRSAKLHDRHGHEIIFNMLYRSMDTINVDLQTNGKRLTNYQFVILPGNKGHTQIVWNVNTNLGWYPWKKIQGIIMDKVTGQEYTLALQNLKKIAEERPVPIESK